MDRRGGGGVGGPSFMEKMMNFVEYISKNEKDSHSGRHTLALAKFLESSHFPQLKRENCSAGPV